MRGCFSERPLSAPNVRAGHTAKYGIGGGSTGLGCARLRSPYRRSAEQTAIVDYVRARTSMLDELISATETSITLVQERRTALIAAAVTGQIAVQDVA